MKKRRVVKIIRNVIVVLVLAAVAFGIYLYVQQQNALKALSEVPNYSFRQVAKGNVDIGVTAKGVVSSHSSTTVVLGWAGTVKNVNFEAGDIVEEGDVLAVIEDDDLKSNIQAANNTLRQQEITLQKQLDALEKTVDAPATGRIKELKAQVGEDISSAVGAYGQVCWISPDGMMELTADLDIALQLHDKVEVSDKRNIVYSGRVTAVTGTKATIEIYDDARLSDGDHVTVLTYPSQIIGEGDVTIKNGIKVTGSGKITDIHVQEGDLVERGQVLFTLDTKDAKLSYESQTISVADAQRKIADLRKDQGKSELLSPVRGVLTEMNLLEGQNANSGQTVAKLQDVDNLETVINVDELDIAKVKVGQKVDITLEALEDKTYTGTVTKIAVIGVNSNNFATYPVTIAFDDPGDVKIGMSCEATINIESAKNVNVLPVEMLQRGRDGYSVLLVVGGLDTGAAHDKEVEETAATATNGSRTGGGNMMQRAQMMQSAMMGGNTSSGGNALSMGVQTELREVQVGLINEDYAQILSGLEEGDWVATETKGSSIMDMMMMGGGNVTVVEGGPGPNAGGGERSFQAAPDR